MHNNIINFTLVHNSIKDISVLLSGAHNTVELLVAIIRRAIHTTAVSFDMEYRSTPFVLSAASNPLKILIKALIGGALLVVISRHEVAIVLTLPPLRACNSGWNHEDSLLLPHLANSTGSVAVRASYDWLLVFSAVDIVVTLFPISTLKDVFRIGGHAQEIRSPSSASKTPSDLP